MVVAVRQVASILLLAGIYVAGGRLGLMLDAVEGFATVVWPPSGIALAALVLYGPWLWPGVALGAFVVNYWNGAPVAAAFGICAGNTLEAVLGAFALRRIPGFSPTLERLKDVLGLVLVACLTTLVAATLGPLSLVLAGAFPPEQYGKVWHAWWAGDMIADLIVCPLLLTWAAERSTQVPARPKETLALAATLVVVGAFVFGPWTPQSLDWLRRANFLLPIMVWAAIRTGTRGLTATAFVTSVIAVAGTLAGYGPLVERGRLHEALLSLQVYLPLLAATFLALAAAMAERSALLRRERDARLEAERAVRVRDDFLAIAAHEIATPLTPLRLELEQLHRGGDVPESAAFRKRIDRAARQTTRLARLTERLLDVSRLSSGRFALEPSEFDFCELVQETVDEFRAESSRAGNDVRVDLPGSVVGRWDRLRVGQVVSNLLSNALKYAPGRPISVTLTANPAEVVLEVADQGPGIEPAALDKIFERFERAGPERRRGGLGLGLYLAKEIVRAHGGTITVRSEPGSGSTFTVTLPRNGD